MFGVSMVTMEDDGRVSSHCWRSRSEAIGGWGWGGAVLQGPSGRGRGDHDGSLEGHLGKASVPRVVTGTGVS